MEQPHFVECGKKEFQDGTLSFFKDIEECISERNISLVLFSSVLQYLENPYDTLLKAVNLNSAVIIDRTPFLEDTERICVQKVPESIYKASYPHRFLNKKRVIEILSSNGRALTPWFSNDFDPPGFEGVMSFLRGI